MTRTLIALALLVAACGTGTTATPTPAPTVEPTGYSDAEKVELMQDSIMVVFSDEPVPAWWEFLRMDGDVPYVEVDGNSMWVGAPGIDADLSDQMCRDIAGVVYDDNAEPIGIRHVHVMNTADEMIGDCNSAT